jgi:DNA mismatch repair protein PMS2
MQITLREHAHIFQQNGFDIHVPEEDDENGDGGGAAEGEDDDAHQASRMAAARRRVCVKTLPFSKQLTFGAGDIYELCALLDEHPGASMVRLPKVTAMLASRACRSAVMIGTSLSRQRMTTIVRHMADLEQPWACPHGRPTMRHLFDLAQLHNEAPTHSRGSIQQPHFARSPSSAPSCCAH